MEFWESLKLTVHTLADLGLAENAADSLLWHECQRRGLVLLTANRNKHGPDSLEATIREHNALASLPVFTLADPKRVLQDKPYAYRVAESLLGYLLSIDHVLGAGRLFLPRGS
jgi:hypothetical protein